MHCRIFNSILDVVQLHASSTSSGFNNQKRLQVLSNAPGEQNHSLLRTAAVQTGVGKFVSVNGQTESILDFVGHTWSLSPFSSLKM